MSAIVKHPVKDVIVSQIILKCALITTLVASLVSGEFVPVTESVAVTDGLP
jgi:hypothetical protein